MQTRDQAFLEDMCQFISMNRIATMYALRQGLSNLDNLAILTRGSFHSDETWDDNTGDALMQEVKQNNDTERIQRIIIAKMFAEMMAAFEDLGAIGFAIKHRNPEGIFGQYFNSKPSEVGSFFDEILRSDVSNHPETSLNILLRLPSLVDLGDSVQKEVFDSLKHKYDLIPKQFYHVAKQYRVRKESVQKLHTQNVPPPGWEKRINIITGIIFPNDAQKNTSVSSDAFNKIKHRFVVAENLSAYANLSETYSIDLVALSQDEEYVQGMRDNTVLVGKVMSELAAMLIMLDQAGVNI
jgi:hypothetical protein